MLNKNRQLILKIAAGAVIGLFVLDRLVLTPALGAWKSQSERLADLTRKVERGRQLLDREKSIRERWEDMQANDLPENLSAAENDVFQGIGRWARDSRISFTSLTPLWRTNEDGSDMFECRASAVGDQASLGRLIYEIETDPLPAHVNECEFTARDAQGKQLALSMRFSFVRLTDAKKSTR